MTDETLSEQISTEDIVFECSACGKSLVINALGAGLAVVCPACGAELQVPGGAGAPTVIQKDGHAEAALTDGNGKVDGALPEISDLLANARTQIEQLRLEVDELQVRRQFLEKRYSRTSQGLQTLRRELSAIRKAFDQVDSTLKTLEESPSGDTQPIA
ncbi:MAG: hypothetical protein HYV36_03020 [Lentisphaerae bacterium]|nr:hypothetical protein [Lentisphaerota bacterium]